MTLKFNDGSLKHIKARDSEILATYQYNPLGQIDTVTRGNGRVTTIGYDAPGRVAHFDHVGVNRSSFDYNLSNQVISRVVSSSNYQIQIPSVTTRNYSVNNLNQYTEIDNGSVYHDTNGNLTSYDGWTYAYNAHNRLTKASKTGQLVDLKYDATGRLYEVTSNGVKTTFLFDGEELVAEYSASGAMTNRYIHGIAEDDPLVRYVGASTSSNGSNKSYLLADERGSIVSETNIYGTVSVVHKYGPYGEPINNSSSRFRYTGQILIPGTELYHYKARVYNPELGHFMQTDPIGYEDGMNWYAYVANDPINNTDPTGEKKFSFAAEIQSVERGVGFVAGGAISIDTETFEISVSLKGGGRVGVSKGFKGGFKVEESGKAKGNSLTVNGSLNADVGLGPVVQKIDLASGELSTSDGFNNTSGEGTKKSFGLNMVNGVSLNYNVGFSAGADATLTGTLSIPATVQSFQDSIKEIENFFCSKC